MNIEPLETRIAPATLVNPTTVTYTDTDGDTVVVKTTRGTFDLALNFDFLGVGVGREQLRLIDVSDAEFAGGKITVVATIRAPLGDGFAHVGHVDATGVDLVGVEIEGDLGKIDAGDGVLATRGLGALKVRSMGVLGISTQLPGGDLESVIMGQLTSFAAVGDLKEIDFRVLGGAEGKLDALSIGGSFIGGAADLSGYIAVDGNIGKITVLGDIRGGAGNTTGGIQSLGSIARLTVNGSLIGGSNDFSAFVDAFGDIGAVAIGGDLRANDGSAEISCNGDMGNVVIRGDVIGGPRTSSGSLFANGDMGNVRIGGDLRGGDGGNSGNIQVQGTRLGDVSVAGSVVGGGNTISGHIGSFGSIGRITLGGDLIGGTGDLSGRIFAFTGITSITIGGDLIGGPADNSGEIRCSAQIGPITIGGDLRGGDFAGAAARDKTGSIEGGRLVSVLIKGSLHAGHNTGGGTLTSSGAIHADDDIGKLTVRGDIVGNATHAVTITARGRAVPAAATDVAIATIDVVGRIEFANIFAGYDEDLTPLNADAQIGKVTVGRDWIASNLIAGVVRGGDGLFGTGDDEKISGAGTTDTARVSKIAGIIIRGSALGTPDGADHFGFVAQHVAALRVGAATFPLVAGPFTDLPPVDFAVGVTGDLRVREVTV